MNLMNRLWKEEEGQDLVVKTEGVATDKTRYMRPFEVFRREQL